MSEDTIDNATLELVCIYVELLDFWVMLGLGAGQKHVQYCRYIFLRSSADKLILVN
jgi:hypothetical protein